MYFDHVIHYYLQLLLMPPPNLMSSFCYYLFKYFPEFNIYIYLFIYFWEVYLFVYFPYMHRSRATYWGMVNLPEAPSPK